MFCSKCGTEIQADTRFCQKCGHPVFGTAAPIIAQSSPDEDNAKSPIATENAPLPTSSKSSEATPLQEMLAGIGIAIACIGFAVFWTPLTWVNYVFSGIAGLLLWGAICNAWLYFVPNSNEEKARFFGSLLALMIFLPFLNPTENSHREAILKDLKVRVAKEPLGGLTNAFGITEAAAKSDKIMYHNYLMFSTTTNPDGKRITFGIFDYVQTTF